MYERLLIPTDGSDGTRWSIDHGLAIATQFDASVHALSVVPEGPLGTLQTDAATPAAERAVGQVERDATAAGVNVETAIVQGVPHEEILTYAADHDIDMIVMGTQGRTGIDRVLVGSVTERVVRMADVPVVTVRDGDQLTFDTESEAIDVAIEAATAAGYDDPDVKTEPIRTSGVWAVDLESGAGVVTITVDGVSGETAVEHATGE